MITVNHLLFTLTIERHWSKQVSDAGYSFKLMNQIYWELVAPNTREVIVRCLNEMTRRS